MANEVRISVGGGGMRKSHNPNMGDRRATFKLNTEIKTNEMKKSKKK